MKQMHGIIASALVLATLAIAQTANAASGDIIMTGSTQSGGRLSTISLSFPASVTARPVSGTRSANGFLATPAPALLKRLARNS